MSRGESLLDVVAVLPWPVGVIGGVIVFVYLQFILPLHHCSSQATQLFQKIGSTHPMPILLGAAFVMAGLFSAFMSWKKRSRAGKRKQFDVPNQPPASSTISAHTPICPQCAAVMVLRTAKQGTNAGKQFWGCSRYPQCRGIVNITK